MINNELPKAQPTPGEFSSEKSSDKANFKTSSRTNFLNLKNKTTLFAIAIGILPTVFTGFVAYRIADNIIKQEVNQFIEDDTEEMLTEVQRFLKERSEDIQVVANASIFTDADLRNSTTNEQKSRELSNFARDNTGESLYISISFMDLKGNDVAISNGDKPTNHFDDDYFEAVIKTGKPFISQPRLSTKSAGGEQIIYFAAPVRDSETNELIGVVRSKMAANKLESVVKNFGSKYEATYHLTDKNNIVFVTNDSAGLNVPTKEHIPFFTPSFKTEQIRSLNYYEPLEQRDVVGTYVTNTFEGEFTNLGWDAFILADKNIAYRVQNNFRKVLIIGVIATVIVVAIISIYVANRLVKPIVKAASTIEKIGQGDLEQRLKVDGNDEVATLSNNINLMTEQIQNLLEEQRQEKEKLETAIYTLIDEVSDASDGDLTVRANLDSLELSTVADLFNAIISNLQEIAIEAKESTSQVGSSLEQNEAEIRSLAERAIAEAKETRDTLKSVAQISRSIQEVAENASQAEKITDDSYSTIVNSTENMDLTVDSILELRATVGDTAKKMKRLGESSQKISQAVSFIEEIALKTNVLAINASVEAGRAGEYGQGFTIVAEQVGALAEQSAAATKEIANIVAAIQAETQEVNRAMESGTTQVVETTKLVESTKDSLNLVLEKSQQINQLMGSISQTTISQANTSQNVTKLMEKIAKLSETSSNSSAKVAQAIMETARVAAKLESTVSQFKVAK